MSNCHYVPRLILRKFGDRVSLYHVPTGKLREGVAHDHAYAVEDYYDAEIEEKLNKQIESQFGNLLSNHILKFDKKIVLNRDQMYLVKKFLLISILRCECNEEFLQRERDFYAKDPERPFEEKQIDRRGMFFRDES